MNDGNAEKLLGWMLAPTDPRDFSVKFKNTIDGKDMKELKSWLLLREYKEYWADGESTTRTSRSYARSSRTAPSPSKVAEIGG